MKMSTAPVWKALADPVRRQLLDLLRQSPQTTSHLVEQFDVIGRCAVMKHLGVLEAANLISVQRKGKFRWNHVNAIPLQEIYERWVKKYEAQWAGNLLQLRKFAEHQYHTNYQSKHIMETHATTLQINLEIPIRSTIDHVWDCLTKEIGTWWRKDFYTSPKTTNFVLEPFVGGRLYEDYGNNDGLLWANVIVLDKPHNIEFNGHLTPQFGGPAISFIKLSLQEKEGMTLLTLSDTVFGDVSEDTEKNLTSGWKMLYEDTFKSYVEEHSKSQ